MLTKQERAAIAKRLREYDKNSFCDFYEAATNETVQSSTTAGEDAAVISDVMLDLCDTSNMIELPLDKDGEVIHIGDTVTNGAEGRICKVSGYDFKSDGCSVLLRGDGVHGWTYSRPDVLTHKEPATIESLVERFEHVLAKGQMSYWAVREISDIVDQLKKLGDKDE